MIFMLRYMIDMLCYRQAITKLIFTKRTINELQYYNKNLFVIVIG